MEYDAYCRITMKNASQLELARLLMTADENAPLFEDDVDADLQQTFNGFEDMPEARSISVDEDALLIAAHWFCNYSEDIGAAINGLSKAGVVSFTILVFGDEGGVDGFVQIAGKLRRLKNWKGKALSKIGVNTDMGVLLRKIEEHEKATGG